MMITITAAPTLPEVAIWVNASVMGELFADSRWRWSLTGRLPSFLVSLGLFACPSPPWRRRCQ